MMVCHAFRALRIAIGKAATYGTLTKTHCFAIFVANISADIAVLEQGVIVQQANVDLWRRLVCILRLNEGEHFYLFDGKMHVLCQLEKQTFQCKNVVHARLISKKVSVPLSPAIILCPALLAKRSFEEVVYYAAAMGATEIQPVVTTKVKRRWGGKKETERLLRIIIAACEQAKNFSLPQLLKPMDFKTFLSHYRFLSQKRFVKIYFDIDGTPLRDTLTDIAKKRYHRIMLMVGPEGDLTEEEKQHLDAAGFMFTALTPTVLRSIDAVAVGLGSMSAVARKS